MRSPRFTHCASVPRTRLGSLLALTIVGLLFNALSAAAQSSPPAPSRPQAQAGDAQITLTWTSNGNGGSAITSWEYAQRADDDAQYGTWTPIPSSGPSTTSHTVTSLTNFTRYSFKVRAVNSAGNGAASPGSEWSMPEGAYLLVMFVSETGANLSLYSAQPYDWWYQGSQQGATCTSASHWESLTGLTPGSTYTYSAYSKDGCNAADKIDTVDFVTKPVPGTVTLAVSNETQTGATVTLAGHTGGWWYRYRRPYSVNSSLGPCTAVSGQTVSVSGLKGLGLYNVSAFAESTCTTAVASARIVTLGLDAISVKPTAARLTLFNTRGRHDRWWYQGTQDGSTCTETVSRQPAIDSLNTETDYTYRAYAKSGCASADEIGNVTFTTQAAGTPTLTVSAIAATTAKLTIVNHKGDWWFEGNSDSCTAVGTGLYSVELTGLQAGVWQNYRAYENAGCYDAEEIARESWHGLDLEASAIKATTATLKLVHHGEAWWHQDKNGGTCTAVAAGTTTADLTSLTAGTAYTWNAYRKDSCASADLIASTSFTTGVVPAAPASVSVTRADGSLTASWPAVNGATSYHVTYSSNGGVSWTLAALNHPDASITIGSLTNSLTYMVAVRARNTYGDSAWRNSLSAGPFVPPPPPQTPASVSVTRADGSLTASWPAVNGATSYHVTYSSNDGVSWTLAALNHPDASITIGSLTNSLTYMVAVRARNTYGDSAWRNSPPAGPFVPPAPPQTPASVSVTRADGSLTASWPAVDGATSYHVTYSSDGASWSLAALNHPDASITIGSLTNSLTYTVGVRARNAHGDSAWRNSSPAGPFVPPAPPQTPASVSVTRADGSLTASWPAVDGATSYHVTYSSDGGASWSLAALNHPDASITIGSLTNSLTYIIGVRARNAHGDSAWRNSPPAGPFASSASAPPAVPSGLTAVAGDRNVTLAWDDPSDSSITGYEIQMRRTGVAWGAWTAIADSDATTTSHVVTDLDNGTEYHFQLRVLNEAGASSAAPDASPWYVASTPVATVAAMSLLQDPSGRLSNLSTLPSNRHGDAVVVPLLLSAADPYERQGLLRIVNRTERAGKVRVEAFDDSAWSYQPLELSVGPKAAILLSSDDLELGNASKGLAGSTGAALEGDWSLLLRSELEIEAQAYVRHADGFVTSMHDMVPERDGVHRVATFHIAALNPKYEAGQASLLRLVNLGAQVARATIEGIDARGSLPGSSVAVEVAGGSSLTLTARELAHGGPGLSGSLGPGPGPWRLRVASAQPIRVMSLVQEPSGHLANHSTAPFNRHAAALQVPLLLSASGPHARQGLLRVVNRSRQAGTVHIEAFDDSARSYAPLELSIGPGAAVHLSSADLESGNAAKGLAEGTGPAGAGDWRLRLTSDLDIEALAYVRHADGLVTSMHDVLPQRGGLHEMALWSGEPGDGNTRLLRLVRVGSGPAQVTLRGIGSGDEVPASGVMIEVPEGRSLTLMPGMLQGHPAGQGGGHATHPPRR